MKNKKISVFFLFIVAFLIVIAATTVSNAASEYGYFSVNVTKDYKAAYKVLDIVNQERTKAGKSKLKMDKDLLEAAMFRASELVLDVSHDRPNGEDCFSIIEKQVGMVGENISAGCTTPEDAMQVWMSSEGHRNNILNSNYKTIGVGVIKCGNMYFWTQIFGSTNLNEQAKAPANQNVGALIPFAKDKIKLWIVNGDEKGYVENGFQPIVAIYNNGFPFASPILNNSQLTFVSSDKSIFTVDKNGTIKGVKEGKAKLTVQLKQEDTVLAKATQKVEIKKKNISKLSISKIDNKAYTGKKIEPDVTIKDGKAKLKKGTDYTVKYENNVKTGKATVTIKGKGVYKGTVKKSFYIVPKKVTSVKVKKQTTTSVTLNWSKATGATGYEVYKYNTSKKKWEKVGSTTKTSYTVKNLKAGTKYKFKVKAYKTVSKKKYYGSYSSELQTATKTSTPKITSLTTGSKKANLKWKKVSGATGYEIYMATSKNGKYSKVKTITKSSTVKYSKAKLKKNKKYYFKVRTYKTVNGKKIYSSYSTVKSIKVK